MVGEKPLSAKKRALSELTVVTTAMSKRLRPLECGPAPAQCVHSTQRPSLQLSPRSLTPGTAKGSASSVWQEPVGGGLGEVGGGPRTGGNDKAGCAEASARKLTQSVRWADAVAEAGGFDSEEAESALNHVFGSAEPWVNRFPWYDERGKEDRQEVVCAGEPNTAVAQLELLEEREREVESAGIAAAAAAAVASAAAAVVEVGACFVPVAESGNDEDGMPRANSPDNGLDLANPAVDDSVAAMRAYQESTSSRGTPLAVTSAPSTPCRTAFGSDLGNRLGSLEGANATAKVCS